MKDFEDNNGGMKKIICKNVCDYINNHDIEKISKEYMTVKKYIEDLCKQ